MWGGFRVDAGFEHESNGQTEPQSRSWNRLYLYPYYENKYCVLSAKIWYRLQEEPKKYPEDPGGHENPDIHRYNRHGELHLALKWPRVRLSAMTRINPAARRGAMRLDLTAPLYTNSMFWYVQYWEGYGESLIDYNIYQRSVGVGVMMTR
jgi:phospholipase A1